MTDAQAKQLTVATLKSVRDTVLELVYNYLWMTLADNTANYLSATGNLTTHKTASSLGCELRNMLQASGIDPSPLIVRKAGKRRMRISYKGLYLHEHIRRKGFRAVRHRG